MFILPLKNHRELVQENQGKSQGIRLTVLPEKCVFWWETTVKDSSAKSQVWEKSLETWGTVHLLRGGRSSCGSQNSTSVWLRTSQVSSLSLWWHLYTWVDTGFPLRLPSGVSSVGIGTERGFSYGKRGFNFDRLPRFGEAKIYALLIPLCDPIRIIYFKRTKWNTLTINQRELKVIANLTPTLHSLLLTSLGTPHLFFNALSWFSETVIIQGWSF